MKKIRLPKGIWSYDTKKPLGSPGGFGAVFRGQDSKGNPVAVKRLHIDAAQAAHRELTIAQDLAARKLQHVVPVLDAGQDSESDLYFVVMPVAGQSLQDHLNTKGPLADAEAVDVLLDIVAGLDETSHIVHRDLKPANVLSYDGSWRIADYGIARFVEESTSARTLKECLSPQYAAPEQWRYEHATTATDIYALGCIAYAVLTGKPPFTGSLSELKEKHLLETPPSLASVRPEFQTVVSMMLRKPPDARPSLSRVKSALDAIKTRPTSNPSAFGGLAAAAAAHERETSLADAERERATNAARRRTEVATEASRIIRGQFAELGRRILQSAPNAWLSLDGLTQKIQVGTATLELELLRNGQTIGEQDFPHSNWDVVCGAVITLAQGRPRFTRGASLWYTRRESKAGDYRWYEVGYESNPLTGRSFEFEPVAGDIDLADRAHWHGVSVVQVAYAPAPVDDEDAEAFYRRWGFLLGEAVAGRLQNVPRGLPSV